MQPSTAYRDAWRGFSLLLPAGWQARRSGAGVVFFDRDGERAIVIQPRPNTSTSDSLEQELVAWLRRFDPQARLQAAPAEAGGVRLRQASLRLDPRLELRGLFALEARPEGGLISGFLVPARTGEADSHLAAESLATLTPVAPLGRSLWREPSEGACSLLAPKGCQVQVRIGRRNPMGIGMVSLEAWADETTSLNLSVEGKLYLEPGPLSGMLSMVAGGMFGQGRFVDAERYAEGHLLPALRRETPDARMELVVPRLDLIAAAVAREAAGNARPLKDVLRGQPTGADVVLSLTQAGQSMRQLSRVVTMRAPETMNRGLPAWMATVPQTHRTLAGHFAEWEPVLEGVAASFRVDPEWRQREQARLPLPVRRKLGAVADGEGETHLEEAERLVCEWTGQALRLYERPFPMPREGASQLLLPALYESPVWRTLAARA